MNSKPEPVIWSCYSALRKPFFDRCQLIISWISNIKDVPMLMVLLSYFNVLGLTCGRTHRQVTTEIFEINGLPDVLGYGAPLVLLRPAGAPLWQKSLLITGNLLLLVINLLRNVCKAICCIYLLCICCIYLSFWYYSAAYDHASLIESCRVVVRPNEPNMKHITLNRTKKYDKYLPLQTWP